jgi:hypothetical protein
MMCRSQRSRNSRLGLCRASSCGPSGHRTGVPTQELPQVPKPDVKA